MSSWLHGRNTYRCRSRCAPPVAAAKDGDEDDMLSRKTRNTSRSRRGDAQGDCGSSARSGQLDPGGDGYSWTSNRLMPGCSVNKGKIAPTLAAHRQMDAVEIPTTVLFEAMLKKLDCPRPMYKTQSTPTTKLVASVVFYPPSSYGFISLEGQPMDTLDEPHNDAAKKGIKYMEVHERKVIRDYNYDKLIEKKNTEDDHINKIIENNRRTSKIIKEKDEQIKKMRKCWANFIGSVGDENDKITAIAKEGYTCGTTQLDKDINSTLSAIETGTEYITQLTFESTDQLQQVARYPHDTDTESSEADQSPGYYPTPPQSPMQDTDSTYEDTYLLNKFGLCAMDYL